MWQLHERVHAVLTDDGGALLDERTGRWTHLTPSAAATLMLLLAGYTQDQAVTAYAARYHIPHDTAAADVSTVITHLSSNHQLTQQET